MSNIALITGAAIRVGAFLAKQLAHDGWSIALHYNSSEKEAYKLAKQLLPIADVMLFKADLTNYQETTKLIPEVNKQFGKVNLLINNASIYKNDNLFNLNSEGLDSHFSIHVKAVTYLAESMAKQDINSNIINIIDSDVHSISKKFFSYFLSKKSMLELTSMLAISLAPNIKVNAVCPGPILFKEGQDLKLFQELISSSPLKKSATLQELYQTIKFLLESSSITGQNIFLDGGKNLLQPRKNS